MPIPFPDPIAITLLRDNFADQFDDNIGSNIDVSQVPSLRVTLVTDREAPTNWERTPIFQAEVWASTALEAGQLATEISNVWPTLSRQTVGEGFISHCWVESQPRPINESSSDFYRYFLEIGMRVHSA
jgi:hypothetical protein